MKISRDLPVWKASELHVMGPADVLYAEQINLQMFIYLQKFGSERSLPKMQESHPIYIRGSHLETNGGCSDYVHAAG